MNVELLVDPMQWVVMVEDKWYEFGRGFDRREDLAIRWKDSSGRSVCGVGGAGYIPGEQLAMVSIQKGVNSLEYLIDLVVSAAVGPPSLNNPSVIAINFESRPWFDFLDDGSHVELHTDCLCPGDVSALTLPTGSESPSSPAVLDDDSDADR